MGAGRPPVGQPELGVDICVHTSQWGARAKQEAAHVVPHSRNACSLACITSRRRIGSSADMAPRLSAPAVAAALLCLLALSAPSPWATAAAQPQPQAAQATAQPNFVLVRAGRWAASSSRACASHALPLTMSRFPSRCAGPARRHGLHDELKSQGLDAKDLAECCRPGHLVQEHGGKCNLRCSC